MVQFIGLLKLSRSWPWSDGKTAFSLTVLCTAGLHRLAWLNLSIFPSTVEIVECQLLSCVRFSVRGIFQARILEWIAISYSRGSSQLWDRTCIFCFAYTGRHFLNPCTIWEASFQFSENPLNSFPHTFQRPLQIKWKSCNSLQPHGLGQGKSPGVGNGNPLQYFCLENSLDRGAWQATVHGVAKSWTQLSNFNSLIP